MLFAVLYRIHRYMIHVGIRKQYPSRLTVTSETCSWLQITSPHDKVQLRDKLYSVPIKELAHDLTAYTWIDMAGVLMLTKLIKTKERVSNYMHIPDVTTHQCPNFNSCSTKTPLKLRHVLVILFTLVHGCNYLSLSKPDRQLGKHLPLC